MQELDERYQHPSKMGKFKIYFGKYKDQDKTFEDVAADEKYVKYIMALAPKTSNMYLFNRYIRATVPEYVDLDIDTL